MRGKEEGSEGEGGEREGGEGGRGGGGDSKEAIEFFFSNPQSTPVKEIDGTPSQGIFTMLNLGKLPVPSLYRHCSSLSRILYSPLCG